MSEEIDKEPTDTRALLEAAFEADAGTPEPVVTAPETTGQPRDETGKFAPKVEASAAQTIPIPDQPAQAAPEAQPEPIRPPASWSAQAKADFATLAPHIQQEVLRREVEVNKGFEERAAKLKSYEPLEAVIAPIRDRLALNSVTPEAYFSALAKADEMLRGPNPVQALAQIAQQYGIDLRQLAAPGQPPQPQAQQGGLSPEVVQRIAQIESAVTELRTAPQQAEVAALQSQIEAFAKDHLYYDNVKPAMAALLREGQAKDLAEAYDMACWARADIRPLLQKEQAAKEAEAAKTKATDAKRAAGSITGSPAQGASPSRSGPPPTTRELLEQQFQAHL